MNTNTGGPAFPSHGSMGEVAHQGMTLRDYFAGQAISGIATCNESDDYPEEWDMDALARASYKLADAMLAAREAKQ